MKKIYPQFCVVLAFIFSIGFFKVNAQVSNNPAPYCQTAYQQVPCAQPGASNASGNFVNDFINGFYTTGAVLDINNSNSGCGGLPNNYSYYNCIYPLQVSAGQAITANFQSGNLYAEGCDVFIDWNQNNIFDLPSERVCNTAGVPPAATWAAMNFTVPSSQANGKYRMRVRSAYATPGGSIDPCNQHVYGEAEDYDVYVGIPPATGSITVNANPGTVCLGNSSILTATGGTTYTWQPGNLSGSSVTVTPSTSTIYTVSAMSGSCSAVQNIIVNVSLCTAVEKNALADNSVQVAPNPFENEFAISVIGTAEIKLFNSLGQLLIEKTINSQEKIQSGSLPNGIYYLSVSNKDVHRVVKVVKD